MSEPQHDIYRMAVEQGGGEVRRKHPRVSDLEQEIKRDLASDANCESVIITTSDAYGEVKPGNRKPTTSFDWELSQAIIHLKNAASVTDSHRAHLLLSAVQIAKGVRESD